MINLIIFQFIVSLYLKTIAVGSQLTVTSAMFHFNNCMIFLSKMLLFPFTKRMNQRHLTVLLFAMLFLSSFSYIFSILSMIITNALVIKLLSINNKVKNTAYQQFSAKLGSLLGVLAVPTYAILVGMYSFSFISSLSSLVICTALSVLVLPLVSKEEIIETEIVVEENTDSKLGIFKLINKYKDIVMAYIFMAILAYFTSNIAFFSRSSRYAIAPTLATLSLAFVYNRHFIPIALILGMASVYYSSVAIFMLTLFTGFINISTKVHAKRKYKDSYLPHLTASFCTDVIFLIFHCVVGIYAFLI